MNLRNDSFACVLLLSLMFCTACVAGQTGSADCKEPDTSCVCSFFDERIVVKGKVKSIDDTRIEVAVDELFNGIDREDDMVISDPDGGVYGPNRIDDLVVGDIIGGSFEARNPCDETDVGYVDAGVDVLVAYIRGDIDRYPNCVEYKQCAVSECNAKLARGIDDIENEWDDACSDQCIRKTHDACSIHRTDALLSGDLSVLPWGREILFGEDVTVASNRIDALVNPSICPEYFPHPTAQPCDDTYEETSFLCSITIASRPEQSKVGFAVFAMLAVVLAFRTTNRRSK